MQLCQIKNIENTWTKLLLVMFRVKIFTKYGKCENFLIILKLIIYKVFSFISKDIKT